MKNNKAYVLELILLLILSYALIFLSNSSRRFILAIFLFVYALATKLLLNKTRMLSIKKKEAFKRGC